MEIKDIIELMRAVSDNGLTKFELENGDTKLVMKREKQMVAVSGTIPGSQDAIQAAAGGVSGIPSSQYGNSVSMAGPSANLCVPSMDHGAIQGSEKEDGGNIIKCPLVGTFYSSPSPEAENFVKVGDHVKKGQVVGIVEAMKLMNEIECEYDGVVEAIFVENETVVEYGQPLFRIRS